MRRVKVALVAGLTLTAVGAISILFHSPSTVAATNGVPRVSSELSGKSSIASGCQAGETLPRDTSAIRLGLDAVIGPMVTVEVLRGSRVITSGTAGTGWYGSAVTVPVRPVGRARSGVSICFRLRLQTGDVSVIGAPTAPAAAAVADGEALRGRMRIEYLRPGGRSWWSMAGTVIRHMGLGRAASGAWIVLPIAALLAASAALASWLVIRELRSGS